MRCGASRGTPSGSTEEYAQEAMSVVVASLLDQLGFTHTNGSSLDTLTSLAISHIKKNFQRLHTAVEHAGRVRPVIADVERIFKNQPNLSEVDLVDYVTQCGSNAVPSLHVPRLGGIIDRSARVSASPPPGIGIRKDLPEFIPSWAPPLFTSEMSDMAQQQALVDALDDIRKKTDAERAKAEAKSRVPVWPDFSQSDLFSLGLRLAIKKSHEEEDVEAIDDQMPSTSTAEYVEPRSTYDPSQYRLEIVDRSHVGTSSSTSVNKPVLPVLRIKLIKPEPPPGTPAPEPRTPATPLPLLRLSEPNSSVNTPTPTPRLSIPLLSVKRPRGRPKLKVIEEGDVSEHSIMASGSASIVDGKADGSQKTEIPILSENVPPTPPVQQRPPPQRTGVHPLLAPMEMTPGMEMLPVRRRGRPPKVKKTFHRKKVAPVAEVSLTVFDGVKKEADELNNQDVNDQVAPAQTSIDGDLLAVDADKTEADLQSVHEGGELQDTDTEPSVYTPESPKEENQQQPAVPPEITKQLSVDVDTSGQLPTEQPTPSPAGKRGRPLSISTSTVVEKPSGTVPQKSPAPARIPRLKPGWVMVPDVRTPSTSSTPQISPLDAVSSTGRSQRQRALPKKFDDFECPDVPSSVLGTRSERLSFSTPASQRGRRGFRAAGGADSVGRTVEAPAPRRHRAETFTHVSPTAGVIDTRRNSLPVQEHAQGPLVPHKGRGRPKKIPTITEPVNEVTVTSSADEPQPGPAPVPSTQEEAQTYLTPRRRGRPPKRFLPEEDVSFEPTRKRNIEQDNGDESGFNGRPMTHGLRTRTGLLSPSARRVLLRDDGLTSGLRAALRRSIEDMGKNKELQIDSGDEVERRLPIPRLSIPLLGRPPKKKRKVIELTDMDSTPVQMEQQHVLVDEMYTEEERPKLRLKITFGGSDVPKQPLVVDAQTKFAAVRGSDSVNWTPSKQLVPEVPVSSHHRRGRKPKKKRGSHLSKRHAHVAYEDQAIQEVQEEGEEEYMLGVVTTVEYLVEETVATIDGDAARLVPFEEIEVNEEQKEENDLRARRHNTTRRKKGSPFVTSESVAGLPEEVLEKVNMNASVPSPSRILNQKALSSDRHIEKDTSQTDPMSLGDEDEKTSTERVQKVENEGGEVDREHRNEREAEMEANETEERTTLKEIVKQVCEQASDW